MNVSHHFQGYFDHQRDYLERQRERYELRVRKQQLKTQEEYLNQRSLELNRFEKYLDTKAAVLEQRDNELNDREDPPYNSRCLEYPDIPDISMVRNDPDFIIRFNILPTARHYIHIPYIHKSITTVECILYSYSKGRITIIIPKIKDRMVVPGSLDDLERAGIHTYIDLPDLSFNEILIRNFSDREFGRIVGMKIGPGCNTTYYYIQLDDQLITINDAQLFEITYEMPNMRYPKNCIRPYIQYVGDYVALDIVDGKINHALLLAPEMDALLVSDSIRAKYQWIDASIQY
jgi:hypothetical protein